MRTKNLILFFGLMRSGHHATMHFLRRLFDEDKSIFLMNRVQSLRKYKSVSFKQRNGDCFPENDILYKDKDLVLISFEERSVEKLIFNHNLWLGNGVQEKYLGEIDNIFYVTQVRDPFNLFASRFKYRNSDVSAFPNSDDTVDSYSGIEKWKEYAVRHLRFLNKEFPFNYLSINYNKFLVSQEYREGLASFFNVPYSDTDWDKMTKEGGGSSFGDSKPDPSLLLNRWRQYKNSTFFRSLFKDKGVSYLSEEIFGKIDGTDMLYDNGNKCKYKINCKKRSEKCSDLENYSDCELYGFFDKYLEE